jgi:RNA-directed DNA polymerase
MNEETQMTAGQPAGASSALHQKAWPKLPWSKIEVHVFRLPMRIAKAEREGRKSKVKAL